MNYTIKNDLLTAEFSSVGAELLSLRGAVEYLWQGDKKYWGSRSPILFPYCCRLFDGYYTHNGVKYEGKIHGFIRHIDFTDVECGDDFIIFRKNSDEQTKALYPFDFAFELKYKLSGRSLICSITVNNTGDCELYYCEGMHPGFNVPLDGGNFEDWYVEFADAKAPRRIIFSKSYFCQDLADFRPSLEDGKKLHLTHSLFDDDAIFLLDGGTSVTLKSDNSTHAVTVDYPDSQAIGFWQPDHTDAPFICIEPLGGIPSFEGVVDEISKKAYVRCVAPTESHTDTVTITVK